MVSETSNFTSISRVSGTMYWNLGRCVFLDWGLWNVPVPDATVQLIGISDEATEP